jgi:hypothetical protein
MMELRKHGEAAYGALSQLPEDQKRGGNQAVMIMLQKLKVDDPTGERAASLKAVRVLERVGNDEARQLLDKLAKGAPGVPLTVEAKAALDRLAGAGPTGGRPADAVTKDVEALWSDLASADAPKAYRAVCGLVDSPGQALPLLRQRLKPVAPADAKHIDQLIAALESDDFMVRERATSELAKLGFMAQPALKRVLAGQPPLDQRRRIEGILESLNGQVPSPEALRETRALEVLDRLDTAEKKALLEALAGGVAEAPLTQDARAALERLTRRSAAIP